jgi:hypothetical protein
LFAVEAREWRTYPDSASAGVRIGSMRRCACPEPADSVAQNSKRRKLETNDVSSLARPFAKPRMRADEPEPEIRMLVDLGFFAFNHLELILFEV